MRIGLVVWSLCANIGGLERMGCDLARNMLERGHDVTILYHEQPGRTKNRKPMIPPPVGATLMGLQLERPLRRLEAVRNQLLAADFDVLVAMFSWDSLLWFPWLLQGTGIPLLISEHTPPARIDSRWNAYERSACLEAADIIHVLSETFTAQYPHTLRDRIRVIANPVAVNCGDSTLGALQDAVRSRRTVLAAGRFVDGVKQFSLLINAFSRLAPLFPDWDLELCGNGRDFDAYVRQIKAAGLDGRVRMPGMVDDMPKRYAAADIFCIPSRAEGSPMVLLEALGCSLPAVGFAACPGVNEIIIDGENGLLAPGMTPESLAACLKTLMEDAGLRKTMAGRAQTHIARFEPERLYAAWEAAIAEAAGAKGRTVMQAVLAEQNAARNTPQQDTASEATQAPHSRLTELLRRRHPFDRSAYIALHRRMLREGRQSPFSELHITGFNKKYRRFCHSGPRAWFTALQQMLAR